MRVANIILNQLGGNKFLTMTGSNNLSSSENSLSMRLRKNNSKANCLIITLTENDDYVLTFGQVRAGRMKVIKRCEMIYVENLQKVFTETTGLDTRL